MNNEDLHSGREIHLTKEYKRKLLIGKILQIIFWVFILLVTVYVSFVMFKAPVKTPAGTIYPSNAVPNENSTVVILPKDDNMIGRLENGILEHNVEEGKVVVGNYGTLLNMNGMWAVNKDGKTVRTTVKTDNSNKKYLNNEYIVKLNSGKEILVSGDKIKSID